MKQTIEIRDAIPQDAEGITNVLYKAWLAAYPNKALGITVEDIEESYKDSFTQESIKKQQEKLANTSPNQKRIVAVYGDNVVGISTMVRNEDDNQLRTIYVLPEFQGKGIGKMLWSESKKFIDPNKKIIVHVASYNENAIGFYKKLGFVDTGKRWSDEKFRMKSGGVIPQMELEIKTGVSGMTLVEVLISLAVFAAIVVAVGSFEANIFMYKDSVSDSLGTTQDAQVILKTIVIELRSAAPGANGAYPLIAAGTSTITFFSGATANSAVDEITYKLIGTTLYRSVIPPTGTPSIYSSANQSTTTLMINVRNASSTPIFQYYDASYTGSSPALSQPVSVTAVRLVQVSLTLDADPNRPTAPVTYRTQVSLRNLKSNL